MLIILLITILISYVISSSMPCTHKFGPVSFDLTKLQLPFGQYHEYLDIRDNGLIFNHSYLFNFCTDIPPPIPNCQTTGHTPFDNIFTKSGDATVFRIERSNADFCHRFAGSVPESGAVSFKSMDLEDLTKGVILSNTGGDSICLNNYTSNRCDSIFFYEFEIKLHCRTDITISKNHIHAHQKDNKISVDLHSIYGCPLECGNPETGFCSNHGKCGFDHDKGSVLCLCYDGYTGSSCNEKKKGTNNAGLYVAITFSVLFVITISVSVIYIFLRLKKINDNYVEPPELKAFNDMGGDVADKA